MSKVLVNNYSVAKKDIDFFKKNGYWLSPVLIEKEELALIKKHYFQVLNGKYDTGIPPHKRDKHRAASRHVAKITNCYLSDTVLPRLVLNYTIGKIAAQFLETKTMRYWRDHLWYKPPESGIDGIVGWHQDYYYWQCAEPGNLISAWIALEDATIENGCLEYIPQSHKWGLLNAGDLYSRDLKRLEHDIKKVTQKDFAPIACEMPAGSIAFHHCLTIHGSRANQSLKPRIGMSVHLAPEGTIYRAGKSIKPFSNEALLGGADGDPFLGVHFPVVYREQHKSNPYE